MKPLLFAILVFVVLEAIGLLLGLLIGFDKGGIAVIIIMGLIISAVIWFGLRELENPNGDSDEKEIKYEKVQT